MANNLIDIKKDDIDMLKDIVFDKKEIIGTDETFFYNEKMGGGSETSLNFEEDENSVSSDKLDLCDKSMEEEMNKVTNKVTLNDICNCEKKRDLNKIPLPIFDCIYCANEKVAFNHLIKEEFFLKYLYNAEKKDIYLINYLIENNLLSIENEKITDKNININKLKSLNNLILNNSEYFSKYFNINESQNYLKQKRKRDNYNININIKKNKIKKIDKFDFGRKKYGQEKNNLFEDDSSDNINENYEKINKLTQNIIENEGENIKKSNKLDNSIEEKICDSFNRLFDDDSFIDLSRKIKWNDIDFEKKPYNIWETNSIDDNIELD